MKTPRFVECIAFLFSCLLHSAVVAATVLAIFLFGAHAAGASSVAVPKAIEGTASNSKFTADAGGLLDASNIVISSPSGDPFVAASGRVDAVLTFTGAPGSGWDGPQTLSGSAKTRFPTGGSVLEALIFEGGTNQNPIAFLLVFSNLDAYTESFVGSGSANAGSVADGLNALADTTAPSVSIDGAPTGVNSTAPFDVTVEFSEDVTGFVSGDVTVGNGSVTGFTVVDGNTYTVEITPDGTGDVTLDVAAAVAQDGAGNDNTAASQVVVSYSDPVDRVVELLEDILQEDFKQTIGAQSRQFSQIAKGAIDRLQSSAGRGCAAEINEVLQDSPVLFATASAAIDPRSEPVLDRIADALDRCPETRVDLLGHTDDRAGDAYNLALSEDRIAAVRKALIARGFDEARFVERPFGEARPFADNTSNNGRAANRRVEVVALDQESLRAGGNALPCGTVSPFDVDGQAEASSENVYAAGVFGSDVYNCVTGTRRITWGEFAFAQGESVSSQGLLTFGRALERQRDQRIGGLFWGGYLSRSNVDEDADGDIMGIGINGGIYGARALRDGLFADYYAAASAGLHTFDLVFDDAIDATGDYRYLGLFAGAALSGEMPFERFSLRPRAGLDFGFAVASNAAADISTGTFDDVAAIDLDPVQGVRGYLETAFVFDGNGENRAGVFSSRVIEVAPRIFCEEGFGGEQRGCGYGGYLRLESQNLLSGLNWSFLLDVEDNKGARAARLKFELERHFLNDKAVFSAGISADQNGEPSVTQSLEIRF